MLNVDEVKVGELVVVDGYPGYYAITNLRPREDLAPMISVVKVLGKNGKVQKNETEMEVDPFYCHLLTEDAVLTTYDRKIAKAKEVKNTLLQMIKGRKNEE